MQFDRTAAANSCRIISVRFSRKCFVSLAPQASSEDSLCSQCSIMWRTLSPQSDSSAANQSLPLCLRQPPHRLVTLKPFQTHLTPPVVAATAFFFYPSTGLIFFQPCLISSSLFPFGGRHRVWDCDSLAAQRSRSVRSLFLAPATLLLYCITPLKPGNPGRKAC